MSTVLTRNTVLAALCGAILGAFGTRAWLLASHETTATPTTTAAVSAAQANATKSSAAANTSLCVSGSVDPSSRPQEHPASRLDALLSEVLRHPEPENQPDTFTQAVDLLKGDAAAREQLLSRYRTETDPYARQQIRALLAFVNAPDVVNFGLELTRDGDSGTRLEGYDMLRTLQLSSPEARAALTNALGQESDPEALKTAVSALVPGGTSTSAERTRIVEQLSRLETHPSDDVRAESLLALSRWNPGQANEDRIYRGLVDSQTPLREAALTALFENPIRTPRMKDALLSLARDESSQAQTREMAVESLNNFSLSDKESSLVTKLRANLPVARP